MHCFNVNDEIPRYEPMKVEQHVDDLAKIVNLEWRYWESFLKKKQQESSLRKLSNLADDEATQNQESKNKENKSGDFNDESYLGKR
ncbi:hypothetical protein EDC96DRAFT_507871 [Choanephora cucurbitarum]|nr:hypothetical protein EDC96DRAFT_507871 [Choanephora cucurbitarum]